MKTFEELTNGDKIYLYDTEDPKFGITVYSVISNRISTTNSIVLTVQEKEGRITDVFFYGEEKNKTQLPLAGFILTTDVVSACQFRYRKTASINMQIRIWKNHSYNKTARKHNIKDIIHF